MCALVSDNLLFLIPMTCSFLPFSLLNCVYGRKGASFSMGSLPLEVMCCCGGNYFFSSKLCTHGPGRHWAMLSVLSTLQNYPLDSQPVASMDLVTDFTACDPDHPLSPALEKKILVAALRYCLL